MVWLHLQPACKLVTILLTVLIVNIYRSQREPSPGRSERYWPNGSSRPTTGGRRSRKPKRRLSFWEGEMFWPVTTAVADFPGLEAEQQVIIKPPLKLNQTRT